MVSDARCVRCVGRCNWGRALALVSAVRRPSSSRDAEGSLRCRGWPAVTWTCLLYLLCRPETRRRPSKQHSGCLDSDKSGLPRYQHVRTQSRGLGQGLETRLRDSISRASSAGPEQPALTRFRPNQNNTSSADGDGLAPTLALSTTRPATDLHAPSIRRPHDTTPFTRRPSCAHAPCRRCPVRELKHDDGLLVLPLRALLLASLRIMAAMRGPRLHVGSAAWVTEERSSAMQIANSEVEEFSYSARNEMDWLNEHMAGIFNENETHVAARHAPLPSDLPLRLLIPRRNITETFKTPGKLRGKTPRTVRRDPAEKRVVSRYPPSVRRVSKEKPEAHSQPQPLSDVFAPTPNVPARFTPQVSRLQYPQVQAQLARCSPSPVKSASPRKPAPSPKPTTVHDSGYFGSQDPGAVSVHLDSDLGETQETHNSAAERHTTTSVPVRDSPVRNEISDSSEKTFQTAHEDQTSRVLNDITTATNAATPREESPAYQPEEDEQVGIVSTSTPAPLHDAQENSVPSGTRDDQNSDDARSPSDGSSPVRPVVRKSSLNFASLPAREPLAAGKSIGARVSRTSHLDHTRTSYYNRPTGGKSLGNLVKPDEENGNHDLMDVDEVAPGRSANEQGSIAVTHTMTYTKRLQDQISRLGQSQSNSAAQLKPVSSAQAPQQQQKPTAIPKSPPPARKPPAQTTPGAFPMDEDEDDWIEPPATATQLTESRPALPKSHSADVMEGIQDKDSISQPDFDARAGKLSNAHGHGKSASVSTMPVMPLSDQELQPLQKAVSASEAATDPSKYSSRTLRESPLKQVKNKLSSIIKSSRGLLASSAAISAEGKSMMSPSAARFGAHSVASDPASAKQNADSQHTLSLRSQPDVSPVKPVARRTRASVEREKEEKRREREAKRAEEQNSKLERAREKERERAHFNKAQEKIAEMEKQIASKKDEDKAMPRETPKATRSSPRRVKAVEQGEQKAAGEDVEMEDVASTAQLALASQSVGPGQSVRGKEVKRPVKPTKEQPRTKQVPTVIRVNTGSQHSQYHPSGRLSTASHDTGASSSQSQHQLVSKSSKASLHAKPSTQSLRNAASVGRPKALDLAAKKKEQDERDAQRRRDAKAEVERKRAAAQEEQRKQAERQRQQDRDFGASQTDGKTPAQRKAAIEKAKQTRAPPPAARPQPNGPPEFASSQDKSMSVASSAKGDSQRPQSRMTANMYRSQDELSRPVNAVLSNAGKAGVKRALGPAAGDDMQSKRPPSRGGPTYQANDAKRRRTSETFEDEAETDKARNIKGPPVRPSAGFKKVCRLMACHVVVGAMLTGV